MQSAPLNERLDAVVARLERHGQGHLVVGLDQVGAPGLESFVEQVEAIDLEEIARLVESPATLETAAGSIRPAPFVPREPAGEAMFRDAGESIIRHGRVAAFTVAGGQGTRLGWNGPKGTFPATPVTGRPLFRIFAEQLNAVDARYGVETPWYVMTSPLNDAATRAFFQDNNHFGRPPESMLFFPQGVMPAVDDAGRLLLEAPGVLAVSPDGHGGSLRALHRSGALDHAAARGIQHLSYFQVDNPTVQAIDPLFVGLHATHPSSSGEMSSKMVPKVSADEKVGVFCEVDGRIVVIEYSDLPESLSAETDSRGGLRFVAGSIAIHLLGLDFVRRVAADDADRSMPFHRARKKVPHWDPESGDRIEPDAPNATKFEMFVFDALAFVERSLVLETDRVQEFAPIKNADGADSASSSAILQTERAARWIEAAGGTVPRREDGSVDARIEITAATALEAGDLAGTTLPEIAPGSDTVL